MHQRSWIHYPYTIHTPLTQRTSAFPPSGSFVDNHPEPVFHPRMNSRSEPNTLHCVRTPLTLHTSCHSSFCYDCFLFTISPPPLYSPVDLAATTDYTAAGYDYFVDDRTPPASFQARRAILFPRYRLSFHTFL